jgi:putative lipoic acid-binding regulatory protein
VIFDDKTQEKPHIDYPTQWGFKIIGRDPDALHSAIKEVMGDKEHLCHPGHRSRRGTFHTYNATCTVESEAERNRLFKAFADHDDIEMVI